MQDLLPIIYPCSKTLYKHRAFCPRLSGRTWEYFLAPLPRYSGQLHPVLCWEQTQLQTGLLHPMEWKPRFTAQEVTAKCPCCSPDLDRECVPGANLPCTPTTFVAEAIQEKPFINTLFIVPLGKKKKKIDRSLIIHCSCRADFWVFFVGRRPPPPRMWTVFLIHQECKIRLYLCRYNCSSYLQIFQ